MAYGELISCEREKMNIPHSGKVCGNMWNRMRMAVVHKLVSIKVSGTLRVLEKVDPIV